MLIKSLNTKFIMGTKKEQTLYEGLIEKGHSRRDFLKFCGVMGGMLGLEGFIHVDDSQYLISC